MVLTDSGITICFKLCEYPNAQPPIVSRLLGNEIFSKLVVPAKVPSPRDLTPSSNTTLFNELQLLKESVPRVFTLPGITIEVNDEQFLNAFFPIDVKVEGSETLSNA